MRIKGDFEYGEEHEEFIYRAVTDIPKTTNAISLEIKKTIFNKIDRKTVRRLLESLRKKGKIKKFKSGRITLWQR